MESESAGGSTIQAGPENVDEREDQPQDEILNKPTEQMVEESRQPVQLPTDCRQMPVVPQPLGEERSPMFQDEILNIPTGQMVEESRQPAQLPADCRQMPVVPQPIREGRAPIFQCFVTPETEPAPTCLPTFTQENQPIVPTE